MEFDCFIHSDEAGEQMTLPYLQNMTFLDISVIIIFIILAYLSKRLGEALKTPPFYKLFHAGIVLIVVALFINTLAMNDILVISPALSLTLPMGLRFIAGILSIFASMQYWNWLFSELFKH